MGTDIHGALQAKYGDRWLDECPIENSRNHRVFAALAGVRNGYGFAGVATHESLIPISEPRGLPAGAVDDEEEWKYGDHLQSWLTLDEVENWPGWDKVLHEYGILTRAAYEAWDKRTMPDGWSGGIFGGSVIVADASLDDFPEGWTHVRVEWHDRTLRDACSTFLKWAEYARSRVGGAEARLVFGFDS